MAALKMIGAGDHAVTGTKTIFYFAARPDLSKKPPGRDWAGDGPMLDEWPLSIELQCRTRWRELLQHELRVLREEGLVMDLHWDTSVGETLVYGGVIGPITVQKEFKTRVFILVSLKGSFTGSGETARPVLRLDGDQKGILAWVSYPGRSTMDSQNKKAC